jgi:hypothetical protein
MSTSKRRQRHRVEIKGPQDPAHPLLVYHEAMRQWNLPASATSSARGSPRDVPRRHRGRDPDPQKTLPAGPRRLDRGLVATAVIAASARFQLDRRRPTFSRSSDRVASSPVSLLPNTPIRTTRPRLWRARNGKDRQASDRDARWSSSGRPEDAEQAQKSPSGRAKRRSASLGDAAGAAGQDGGFERICPALRISDTDLRRRVAPTRLERRRDAPRLSGNGKPGTGARRRRIASAAVGVAVRAALRARRQDGKTPPSRGPWRCPDPKKPEERPGRGPDRRKF